jgi:hypothetical protein
MRLHGMILRNRGNFIIYYSAIFLDRQEKHEQIYEGSRLDQVFPIGPTNKALRHWANMFYRHNITGHKINQHIVINFQNLITVIWLPSFLLLVACFLST